MRRARGTRPLVFCGPFVSHCRRDPPRSSTGTGLLAVPYPSGAGEALLRPCLLERVYLHSHYMPVELGILVSPLGLVNECRFWYGPVVFCW